MSSLHSLPEHLVGHLFSLLPDTAKKAFYSCSSSVRDAPAVLDQIHKLEVRLKQFCPIHCPLAFPRTAQLRGLVVDGLNPREASETLKCCGQEKLEQGQQILQVLHPQDADIRAKLQQITHLTLHYCKINPDYEAQLCALLCSLPNLQSLTLHTVQSSSLVCSLSDLLCSEIFSLRLKELHCLSVDLNGIQAVSKLSSLESLSWCHESCNDRTPNILQPLSKLTALRHLSILGLGYRDEVGFEAMLPHLQHLSHAKLGGYGPLFQLTAIPCSLRNLELDNYVDAEQLCDLLESTVQGTGLPSSLQQLKVCKLAFCMPQENYDLSDWHVLGLRMASSLAALPSELLSVGHVYSVPWLRPFLAFIEAVPMLAPKLTSIVFETLEQPAFGTLASSDLARLATLCPNIEEMNMMSNWSIVQFQDLKTSLKEIYNGFPRLSCFFFAVDFINEPHCVDICVDFLVALATDQRRCDKVSLIKGLISFDSQHHFASEDEVEDEDEDNEHSLRMEVFAESLEQAWARAKASLGGKAQKVQLIVWHKDD